VSRSHAYATGLRASEVVAVRIQDNDSSRMVIHVDRGKSGRQCYVMLPPTLPGILRAYWKIERPCHWLFTGRRAMKPLDPAVEAPGLRKRATVHSLRHNAESRIMPSRVCIAVATRALRRCCSA
jgi:integrase/recombinase XerD